MKINLKDYPKLFIPFHKRYKEEASKYPNIGVLSSLTVKILKEEFELEVSIHDSQIIWWVELNDKSLTWFMLKYAKVDIREYDRFCDILLAHIHEGHSALKDTETTMEYLITVGKEHAGIDFKFETAETYSFIVLDDRNYSWLVLKYA